MKYYASFITISFLIACFYIWYKSIDHTYDVDPNLEVKARLRDIQDEQKEIRQEIKQRQGRDTIYNYSVKQIEKNFIPIYHEIDTANTFDPLIEFLLAGHRKTPVERSY